jgi:hypothetical protein
MEIILKIIIQKKNVQALEERTFTSLYFVGEEGYQRKIISLTSMKYILQLSDYNLISH